MADLDTPVVEIAERLRATAFALLGPTPFLRIGRAPKQALCYRIATPIQKLRTPELFLEDGTKLQVEILGSGQQMVAFGMHPDTGRPYAWPDASPLTHTFDDLPETTPDALTAFMAAAEGILRAAGAAPRRAERPVGDAGAFRPREDRTDIPRDFRRSSREEVESALKAVPNTHDWHGWVKIGAAIHAALGESGRDLFFAWSAQSAKNDLAATRTKWLSFSTSPMDTTAATLFWEAGQNGWKPERKRQNANQPPNIAPLLEPPQAAEPADVELTEHGVAAVYAARCKDALRFCHHSGWYIWTGTYWRRNETRLPFHWVRSLAAQLSAGKDARLRATLGQARFASAVERFAQADPSLAVTSAIWDQDPWLLGTPDGTVDLRTGATRQARREDYITRCTAVASSSTANCPVWLGFLHQAAGGDQDVVAFMQRWFGYCLTGMTREHALVFVHGPGGNGKGVLLNTITQIVGTYAAVAPLDALTALKGERHTTDLAMLHGARIVLTTETEEGRFWAEARVKAMTGGDPITARFMKRDNFTYTPAFKLTISGNHKPALRNLDDAARRRFLIVNFLHKPIEPDKTLTERLKPEWPAILRWGIEGCAAWQSVGLAPPRVVLAASQEYFAEQDLVAQWIEDCCTVTRSTGDATSQLFESWRAFAIRRGEEPRNTRWLGADLERRGFARGKDCEHFRGRGFLGIRALPPGVTKSPTCASP